jgi:hypothetical protein
LRKEHQEAIERLEQVRILVWLKQLQAKSCNEEAYQTASSDKPQLTSENCRFQELDQLVDLYKQADSHFQLRTVIHTLLSPLQQIRVDLQDL